MFLLIQTLTLQLGNHNEKNAPNVESTLEIYYFDVGQGDSTLIKQDDDYMLIDAGNNEDGKKIVDYLKNNLHINNIDYLIGTHSHEDHIGGIDNIIERIDTT